MMAARTRTQKDALAEVQAQIAALASVVSTLAENAPAKDAPASPKGKGKGTTRKSQPKAAKGAITAGELWVALGADPAYEPRDHERTQFLGRMFDLANSKGLLRLA